MNWATHEVTNQVPDLVDYNLYDSDQALRQGVAREGGGAHDASLLAYGAKLGEAASFALACDANNDKPQLEQFDRRGCRVDRVHFHPAWGHFMRQAFRQGMHCSAWEDNQMRPSSFSGVADFAAGGQVARAAAYLMHGQVEAGSLCPITMTSAAIPVLCNEPWFDTIAPRLFSRDYDDRDMPLAGKTSMMIGMGMTEKQGGSDLRSNTTQARPEGAGGRGQPYGLVGHKWFFSSPTSDAHLVLARAEEGFSCFYVPRWLDDGHRNAICLQRLKNKLGNASNASAEVEFQNATGWLVGEPGRGIATLVEMASFTRLDCVLGSAALQRQALVQALHHARHRKAFGELLINQPLMQSVLVDLALESEAATILALRLARTLDAVRGPSASRWHEDQAPRHQRSQTIGDGADSPSGTHNPAGIFAATPLDQAFVRILTPAAKFWVCKRGIEMAAECMEVLGGNGYIEEGPLARLYRETPVNSIWEGSGNVMCLDVLRAMEREPELADALLSWLRPQCLDDALLRQSVNDLRALCETKGASRQRVARRIAQDLVLLTQAALLRAHVPQAVADAFVSTRFGRAGRVFGVIGTPLEAETILGRAFNTL
ncbi:acyl-CoA dehydrogenase family protein [Alcaligenaceae bacterium]|nr:acyl-CoA dehydrogenase family protein [Alcaligenaceae bacterium]